ncbi:membrane protein [Betaproteobacteria bacterium]|nr:membrane protein [Betaproteobacteria bacterium]GHT98405.1 membrane protein [Betaproteobacteria bacterium]GHU23097.1 membrane protein [Betaproteobacteria bacterium]GHU28261.1 membrane protein [Betaproteobacteria bacterium]
MNTYLIVKWLHILSSVLMVGTGFGTAFYLFFINRTRNVEAIAEVSRLVVRADTWFTTPAVIFQPLSGWWLMQQGGWTLTTGWVATSLALFILSGVCWLPVVWLQLKLRNIARHSRDARQPLPAQYWRIARAWELLGYPAFIAVTVIFFLMVNKSF